MKILFTLLFCLLFHKLTYAKNIYELAIIGLSIPVLFDQYYDNSLEEDSYSNKKNRVLGKFYNNKLKKDFRVNINSKSDLIYYLSVTDKLNIYRNKY